MSMRARCPTPAVRRPKRRPHRKQSSGVEAVEIQAHQQVVQAGPVADLQALGRQELEEVAVAVGEVRLQPVQLDLRPLPARLLLPWMSKGWYLYA